LGARVKIIVYITHLLVVERSVITIIIIEYRYQLRCKLS